MRNVAPSLLLVVWTAVSLPVARAADIDTAVGKKPEPEVTTAIPAQANPATEETPNQRRRRLGQPIVASYPVVDYGESVETPNQRKKRLGLPVEPSFPSPEYGTVELTPNQLKKAATAAKIADRR